MSASECILKQIEPFGNATAQIDAETDRELTFDEIRKRSARLTKWFRAHNLGVGNTIGLMSQNNVDFVWIFLGILDSGAACHLFNPKYTLREILHSLVIAPVDCLVLQKRYVKTVSCQETAKIKHILAFGDEDTASSEKVTQLEEVLRNSGNYDQKTSELRQIDENTDNEVDAIMDQKIVNSIPADLALILSSSGSSGLPKGVMITHDNILAALKQSERYIRRGERAIGLMPFHHAYGLITMLMCLYEGATMINIGKFSLSLWIKTIKDFSVSYLHIVPSLSLTLLKSDSIDFSDLRSVKHILVAAAPISESEHKELQKKFHQPVTVHKLYGLTETTYVVVSGEFDPQKPGALGKPVEMMECMIIDEESKNVLGPNSVGEMCIKGPMVTKGYINNPEATACAIHDGWFRTGDLGYFDKDGYFYFVDRIKFIIKYQGYQVSPSELEYVLSSNQDIKEAAVVGIEHDIFGQVPRAFIIRQEKSNVVAQEIHDFMRGMVAPFKLLRGGLVFVSSIPMTSSRKIQRQCLHTLKSETVFYDQKMGRDVT